MGSETEEASLQAVETGVEDAAAATGEAVDAAANPVATDGSAEEDVANVDSVADEVEAKANAPDVQEHVVSEATHKSMQGNKRADTKPELLMRRELRAAGYPGYRLQWKKVPGHPDIAYPGRKVAIFINGCFWHHHEGCKYATTPKSNVEYWTAKFERNVERDQQVEQELESMGWRVIVVWECELKKDKLASTVEYVVEQLREADEQIAAEKSARHLRRDRGDAEMQEAVTLSETQDSESNATTAKPQDAEEAAPLPESQEA